MEKNNKKLINNAHDQFFRTVMSDKRVARDFLSSWLPRELYNRINLDRLELQPRSYINDVRQESAVDVLYKTMIEEHEGYLYLLLEHQSTPDPLMPFRLLKYMCNIIDHHLKRYDTKKIPLIYPLVIYHGKQKYPYSCDLQDIVSAPKGLVERYFLKAFHLIDLGQIDDKVLKQHAWSGVMEFALKHIFDRDILPWLSNMTDLLQELANAEGRDYVEIVLQYLLERGEVSDEGAFLKLIEAQISSEVGEKLMSIAERFREKGRQEGRQEGQSIKEREIAKRMLEEGVDPAFVAKVTGLSLDTIKILQ